MALTLCIADAHHNQVLAAEKKVGFFERIFGKRKGTKAKKTVKKKVVRKPQKPAGPVISRKFEDAEVVLVVGDFFAAALGNGLNEAFAKDQAVKIVSVSTANSGLVRDDVVNWPEKLAELVAQYSPSAVVFMAGANDRQKLKVPSGEFEKFSVDWNIVYRTRIADVAASATQRGVPFFWVSAPPVADINMQSDFLTINSYVETELSIEAGEFINIWNQFVDDDGAYTRDGADISGQKKRLRTKDGINFTRAGRRKMAFYVEQPLRAFVIGNDSNIFALTQGGAGLVGASPGLRKTTPMMALDAIDVRASLAGGPKALEQLKAAQEIDPKDEKDKPSKIPPQTALTAGAKISIAPEGRVDAAWNKKTASN